MVAHLLSRGHRRAGGRGTIPLRRDETRRHEPLRVFAVAGTEHPPLFDTVERRELDLHSFILDGARPSQKGRSHTGMNAEKVRDHWVAELTPPPVAGADGAASEPLLQALMRELGTAAIPILRPDPEHTWIWSDLHLGDRAMVDAWSRPFRNLTHMNRELLAEWRRRVRPGDTIICLGDVAHPDAWREHSRLQLDLAGCPGERMLILGNHDFHTRDELALAGFDKQYAAAVCDTRPVLILTHSPLQRVPADTVNLHGHIHAAPAPTRHHRNLSVERTGYQPIRLSEVLTTDLRPASST